MFCCCCFCFFFTCTWTSYLFPEALPQTTGSCHISSLFLIGFIFFDPHVIDPTDFRGATVICQIIAHYQAVLILRALKYLIKAQKPSQPMAAPATVTLDGSVGCLLHADSGHPVTVVPSWVRTLSVQQMWSNSTADASPASCPGSDLVELE